MRIHRVEYFFLTVRLRNFISKKIRNGKLIRKNLQNIYHEQ